MRFCILLLPFCSLYSANEHTLLKDLAKVVGGEFIQLRPDAHILRQTPHQGQG